MATIAKLSEAMKVYSDRDLLFSILLALDGGVGGSGTNSGAGAPAPGDGADGDLYFNTTSKSVYRKEAGVWVVMGTLAKSVTDSDVTFETPTAGDGTAPLTTI